VYSERAVRCFIVVVSACLAVSCNQPVCDTATGGCLPDGGAGGGTGTGGSSTGGSGTGGSHTGGSGTGGGVATGGSSTGGSSTGGGGAGTGGSSTGGGGVGTGGGPIGGGSAGGSGNGGGASTGGGGGATGGGSSGNGETCATAQLINVPATGTVVTLTPDVSKAQDDVDGSCNALMKGPELVYRLPMPAGTRLTAVATRPAGSIANPVLYLRTGPCTGGTELACSDDPNSPGATETVSFLSAAAQDLFLYVEGRGMKRRADPGDGDSLAGERHVRRPAAAPAGQRHRDGDGRHELRAQRQPAGRLVSHVLVDERSQRRRSLLFVHAHDRAERRHHRDAHGSEPDLLPRSLRPPAPAPARAAHRPTRSPATRRTRRSRASRTCLIENQQPGTYFIVVDSEDGTAGPFALDLMLSAATPAPPNDTCAAPAPLTFVGGIATGSGDTTHARATTTKPTTRRPHAQTPARPAAATSCTATR